MDCQVDCPGLESVTVRQAPGFIAMALHLVIILALLGTAAWLILMVKDSPVPMNSVLILAALLLTGVLGLWLLDAPFFDSGWTTDAEGLTISRTWKPRRILWSQVTYVETRWVSLMLGRRYIITTPAGSVFVPTTYPDLAASMWLHLARIGMASTLKLENDAESLLTPVDATFPTELQWANPYPPSITRTIVIAAITITAMLLLEFLVRNRAVVYFGAIILTAILDSARSGLTMARRCTVCSDCFEADTILRKIRVRWEDVKSAKWNEAKSGVRLRISWCNSVLLPWYGDDEESHALIAAVAGHLRNRRPQLLLTVPCEAEEE